MQSIHITTLRKILSSPEPIDIRLWTRSGEIRQLRDVCIFEVNGIEVYM